MLSKDFSVKGLLVLALSILLVFTSCEQPTSDDSADLSSAAALTEFAIGTYDVSVDDVTTLTISVPYDTVITALTPMFAISAGATASPASGTVFNFVSGTSQNVTVTAEDGSTKIVYAVTVTVTPASTDSSLKTPNLGTLTGTTITGIPAETTVDALKSALAVTSTDMSIFEIYDVDNSTDPRVLTVSEDVTVLTSENIIIVTAQDTTTTEYTISVAAANRFVLSDPNTNYNFDGEIDLLVAEVPTVAAYDGVSIDSMVVTGVITQKSGSSFTIQDSKAAIMVYATTEEGVGTKVTFSVTEVKNYKDQYEATKIGLVTQVAIDQDLYVQDAAGVTLGLATQNQLYKYYGFATGGVSTVESYFQALDGNGLFFKDNADDETTASIALNKGTFYGPSETKEGEYYLTLTAPEYFVTDATPVTFSPTDIANAISINTIASMETNITYHGQPEGYTVTIDTSNNEAVVSTDGTITAISEDVIVELGLIITDDTITVNKTVSVTVPAFERDATGNIASDLFISEYIEGGGYRKALEIANYTGGTINLSNYSLVRFDASGDVKGVNGLPGVDFTVYNPAKALALPDMELINTGLWVVINPKTGVNAGTDVDLIAASDAMKAAADLTELTDAVTGLNGDDAIGLFKNTGTVEAPVWVLIDLFGEDGDGSVASVSYGNFAKDKTFVRKPGSGPSLTWDMDADWFEFDRDNVSDLKNHVY